MRSNDVEELLFLLVGTVIAFCIFAVAIFGFSKVFDSITSYHAGEYQNYKDYKERTTVLDGRK
ncbi:hypothetical protein ACF0HT_14180 (plasmid) [Staphylococcus xylosus]|uniref:hypothetical protein n=1 Tax=Staphylococcus xylosus TaxID=1288 RepID=UPI0037492575